MTGSFDLNKPILLTAVVASGFSRRFGLNIYDSGTSSYLLYMSCNTLAGDVGTFLGAISLS